MRTIVLLRGINVGGHRKLPMADLRAWLGDAGFGTVRTYIQSGNVAVDSDRDDVADVVRRCIADHAGFDVPVVALPASDVVSILAADPFPAAGDTQVHVGFALPGVSWDRLHVLAAADHGPDALIVREQVWLHTPDGIGRSRLGAQLGRVGGNHLTMRNRATLRKLLAL